MNKKPRIYTDRSGAGDLQIMNYAEQKCQLQKD